MHLLVQIMDNDLTRQKRFSCSLFSVQNKFIMLRFLAVGVGLLNIELCSLFLLPNKLIGCKLGSFFEVGLAMCRGCVVYLHFKMNSKLSAT